MKFKQMGWVVAAALLTVAATAGFQGGTTKIGTVDATKVFNESAFAKDQVDVLKALGQARQDMLQFVDMYRTFTTDQADRFHVLSLKVPISPVEKTELDKIKGDVQTAAARLKALQTKPSPTADESKELTELSKRVQTTTDTAQKWSRDAQEEFEAKRTELQKAGLDKVREAIKQTASAQGYTIVFIADIAPYSANDLTADTLKVMNKK
jgi:Skp family chaperone for outer membrane proteins